MAFPDTPYVIDEPPFAELGVATQEPDAGCEIRIVVDAPPWRFMPGYDREREEMRALKECRRRRAGLSD